MLSTFKLPVECPVCNSRRNKWVSSVWDDETNADVTVYQCKECLNLFEHKILLGEDDTDEEVFLEM